MSSSFPESSHMFSQTRLKVVENIQLKRVDVSQVPLFVSLQHIVKMNKAAEEEMSLKELTDEEIQQIAGTFQVLHHDVFFTSIFPGTLLRWSIWIQ